MAKEPAENIIANTQVAIQMKHSGLSAGLISLAYEKTDDFL